MSFFKWIKNLIFDTSYTCVCCRREIPKGSYICEKCFNKLPVIEKNCERCGRRVTGINKLCDLCRNTKKYVDKGSAAFDYDDIVKGLVYRYKYGGALNLTEFFAKAMCYKFLQMGEEIDFVTFIPMTYKDKNKRGYNQSYHLAKAVSVMLEIPLLLKVRKTKQTKIQKRLDYKHRQKNLKNAFSIEDDVEGKSVLVVDDVLTTGATLDEMARCLKKNGAKRVVSLVIAGTYRKKN